ncbi:MAG: DUF4912 domain-containing protein [Nitrospirae bacterium]|nr:DUF4912 domain-containing protein [Nitrospirota bacterium]
MRRVRRPSPSKPSRPKSARPAKGRRAELLARARSFGIKGRHRMTLTQLIRALAPFLKEPDAPAPSLPTSPPPSRSKRYEDLPWSYGETELVLMPVDPFLIHAYWDFSPEDWQAVCARRQPVVLRIYDVTMIEFNGTNAHHFFDLPVTLETQNWYARLWSAEKSLCADLGWPLPDGSFETLVRSNVIQTPRAGVSIFEEARWLQVQPEPSRRSARPIHGKAALRKPTPKYGKEPISLRRVVGPKDLPREKQTAFWRRLEHQTAEITGDGTADFSSARIRPITPPKTPA